MNRNLTVGVHESQPENTVSRNHFGQGTSLKRNGIETDKRGS